MNRHGEDGNSLLSLLFAALIIAICLFYYFRSTGNEGSVGEKAIERSEAAVIEANRSVVALALQRYRLAHRNQNPRSLRDLVREGLVAEATCRDANGDWLPYDPQRGTLR